MTSFPSLRSLRIGCVQYLNAKPLIAAYPGEVLFEHPSRLAAMLSRGELDVALVPTFEALRCAENFRIADGVSISSLGAVYSVFLAYRGQLSEVKTIALDPASLTSVNLLRCLLAEFHQMEPEYVSDGDADAQLWIGNQAIEFRQRHCAEEWHYLDLGEEWLRRTGLPFVFAVWLIRPEVSGASEVATALRALKQHGIANISKIASEQTSFAPEFARQYLSENIRFDLADAEKAGIEKFRELLTRHGLIPKRSDCRIRFV